QEGRFTPSQVSPSLQTQTLCTRVVMTVMCRSLQMPLREPAQRGRTAALVYRHATSRRLPLIRIIRSLRTLPFPDFLDFLATCRGMYSRRRLEVQAGQTSVEIFRIFRSTTSWSTRLWRILFTSQPISAFSPQTMAVPAGSHWLMGSLESS